MEYACPRCSALPNLNNYKERKRILATVCNPDSIAANFLTPEKMSESRIKN